MRNHHGPNAMRNHHSGELGSEEIISNEVIWTPQSRMCSRDLHKDLLRQGTSAYAGVFRRGGGVSDEVPTDGVPKTGELGESLGWEGLRMRRIVSFTLANEKPAKPRHEFESGSGEGC